MLETNQPAKPFLGIRFVLAGFNSIEESKIRYKLIDGGGVDSGQYNPNCTHVIVDKIVYDDPLCVAARKDCKTVVTGLWVDHSYDIGMAVDFTSVMYRPPKDLNGIPGAKSLVMCLTGYQRQDRDDIMTLVGLMGAQFSKPLVAHKVTHLICYKFEGEKYELGKKLSKTKLVNHRWLEDCLKEWEILPEANYNKSGYDLEMMEAEAKDSEEEAEDTSLKPFSGENMQRSPCNLKPSFPQAHDSPKLSAETLQIRDPTIISNAKDKSSVQGIDNRSERTSGLDNIPVAKAFGYHDVGGLKETAHGGLTQSHYQSPFRKHAANDLTPDSRRTEGTPNSDGKSGPLSYTRKIQRNLGDLSSGHGGFDRVAMKANDLSSSFSKQDQAKDVIDSVFFEPQKENNLLSGKRPTTYSPQKSKQTSSYGTPNLQKMQSEVRPCIRKSLSPCDIILGVGTSFFDRLHDTDIIEADNEITNIANPAKDLRSTDTLTLESTENANQNEKTSPSSSKRIKTSLSGFADFGDFGAGDSSLLAADIRDQNHQQDVKGSAASKQDRESDKPSSSYLEGDDNSITKLLKKKTVARKTLGSRPKIASKANKKGSLYLDKRDSTEDEAGSLSKGQEDEKSEQPVDAGLCYPIISDKAPKTIKTKDVLKSEDNATRKTETLDDETETPEDKVEQVLDKVIEEVNGVSVESAEKTDTAEEKETETESSLKDITASTRQTAPEPGNQGIVSENVVDTNVSSPAGPNKKKAKKVEATEGVESKECVDAEVTCNETDKVNEKDNVKKAVKRPAAKSKHRKASKNNSEKSAEEEKENTPVDGGAENKAEAKRGTKRQAIKSDDTQLNINKSSEKSYPNSSGKIGSVVNKVRSDSEPVLFILSGHRFQRREFQKVIRRLKGRFCRDSHQWSYQATHFIVPDPIRRTEKFFAAAASGRWILKTDYLTASNESGKFQKEDDYEWHKNGLNEDGAINLEAPRKWRLLRQRTGHGAFYGMRIIIYGECIAPPLDTLKRVVKAGDGTILATSPPYTRFLNSGVDFAVVSPGMPRVDAWVQEFLKHEVPCVVADYLVEYVCKPGYSLEKHVLYNTHAWANKSFARLESVAEEVVLDSPPPSDYSGSDDDIPCEACGSRDRGDVMLICGDESGLSGCGVGCHIDCCDPPLEVVPVEDWLCSECSIRISRSNTSDKSKKTKKN